MAESPSPPSADVGTLVVGGPRWPPVPSPSLLLLPAQARPPMSLGIWQTLPCPIPSNLLGGHCLLPQAGLPNNGAPEPMHSMESYLSTPNYGPQLGEELWYEVRPALKDSSAAVCTCVWMCVCDNSPLALSPSLWTQGAPLCPPSLAQK